tara:strand:- start:19 stop:318 length:300 start_codon:yes stop_codon:yes gene_type:complete
MINKNLNNVDAALMAGGSRPMHQAGTSQVDMMNNPMQGNAPNMGNFGGAMANSNIPMYDQSMSPGAIAMTRAEKIEKIDKIPGMPEDVKNEMKKTATSD